MKRPKLIGMARALAYAEAGSTAGKREKKRVRLSMFDAPSAAHARTEAEARGS